MDTRRLGELLQRAFDPILGGEEIDILPNEAGNELEVMDTTWIVRITGWPEQPVATVSISQLLGALYTLHDSREEQMAYEVDEAFAYVDRQVGGALITALGASADALSLDLADAIAEHQARFAESRVEIVQVTK